jgi:hypothetical protein
LFVAIEALEVLLPLSVGVEEPEEEVGDVGGVR